MAAPSAEVAHHRASLARRTQSYPGDHPRVQEAKRSLDYAKLNEHAARVVATWPDPTPEQLAKVAAILRGASPPKPAPQPRSGGSTAPRPQAKTDVGGAA